MSMALYMQGDRPFAVFLSSKPGVILLVAIATFLITGDWIRRQYRAHPRHFSLLVTMNLIIVLLMLVGGGDYRSSHDT